MLNSGDDISMIADWLSENMQIPKNRTYRAEINEVATDKRRYSRPSHNACKGYTVYCKVIQWFGGWGFMINQQRELEMCVNFLSFRNFGFFLKSAKNLAQYGKHSQPY